MRLSAAWLAALVTFAVCLDNCLLYFYNWFNNWLGPH